MRPHPPTLSTHRRWPTTRSWHAVPSSSLPPLAPNIWFLAIYWLKISQLCLFEGNLEAWWVVLGPRGNFGIGIGKKCSAYPLVTPVCWGLTVWRNNNNNKRKKIDIPYDSNVKVRRKKELFMGLQTPLFSHPDSLECWYLGHETAWSGSL